MRTGSFMMRFSSKSVGVTWAMPALFRTLAFRGGDAADRDRDLVEAGFLRPNRLVDRLPIYRPVKACIAKVNPCRPPFGSSTSR